MKRLLVILFLVVIPFLLVCENLEDRPNLLYIGYLEDCVRNASCRVDSYIKHVTHPL